MRSSVKKLLACLGAMMLVSAFTAAKASAVVPCCDGGYCSAYATFTQGGGKVTETISFDYCYGWYLDGYSSFTENNTTYKHLYSMCTWTTTSSCVSSHTFTNPAGSQKFEWQTEVHQCVPGGCITDTYVWAHNRVYL